MNLVSLKIKSLKVFVIILIIYSAFIPVYLADGPVRTTIYTELEILTSVIPQLKSDQIAFYLILWSFLFSQVLILIWVFLNRLTRFAFVLVTVHFLSYIYLYIYSNNYYFSFNDTWTIGFVLIYLFIFAFYFFPAKIFNSMSLGKTASNLNRQNNRNKD